MTKSIYERFGPPALARGLWGRGPIPTRYRLLFLGQGLIFTMAVWIRTKDVDKAQKMKKLADAERQRAEMRGESPPPTNS